MPFTIDNVTVTFDMATFEALCTEEKVTWSRSSLKDLRAKLATTPAPGGGAILQEIRKIPMDKRLKYKPALKYVLFSWPGVVDPTKMNPVADGRMAGRLDFQGMFATMNGGTDFVDLQYGISGARAMTPYRLTTGRVRFADDFNNASNLGTGAAFKRSWQGYGFLDAKKSTITAAFRKGEQADDQGRTRGIASATRNEYVEGMLGSRYSPTRSLGEGAKKLTKDTQQSLQTMAGIHGQKHAQEHFVQHARFVKSVRRACKGGIAMVASHPGYRGVDAKVHFVLDGLGDLGKMARKDKLPAKGDYVAITSSELAFCCRYWNNREFPLNGVVKFYINGDRVYAPWEADYTVADAQTNNVYSNQEAWLRYQLCQELIVPPKPFPKMTAAMADADDDD
jgi:hypothetical protein